MTEKMRVPQTSLEVTESREPFYLTRYRVEKRLVQDPADGLPECFAVMRQDHGMDTWSLWLDGFNAEVDAQKMVDGLRVFGALREVERLQAENIVLANQRSSEWMQTDVGYKAIQAMRLNERAAIVTYLRSVGGNIHRFIADEVERGVYTVDDT